MSALAEHVQNYLTIRRALGFKLVGEEHAAARVRRVRRRRRAAHGHYRDRAAMGQAAGERQPQLSVAAAASRPRLRALPARARPGLRGPAAGAFARE